MSNGTRPGLLVADLLAGDGPYQALAASFVSAVCADCERPIERAAMRDGESFYCTMCGARASGQIVVTS